MPFTVSHIAAVLPLRRHCSMDVFVALAIGSMMPDMHYFLPVLREHWPLPSHHLISLPLFCLPAGWLLWRLWRPLWVPVSMVDGHEPPVPAPWRVMLALIVGALTHLAWDACTHANYGLGLYLPALGQPLFRVDHAAISAANLLQYGSSVAGLLVLVMAAWPARQRFVHGMREGVAVSWLVAALFVVAILTALLTFALTWNMGENVNQLRHTLRLTAWNGLSMPLLIVMLYPLIWRLRQRKAIHTSDQLP
ncbi:DUF4184 family protein [Dyella japonica]|uniref:DUF4184 family protein n=1 Tax=Dyella japonica TaxID=231455 RepID=A0ABV2JZN2_9GAMM